VHTLFAENKVCFVRAEQLRSSWNDTTSDIVDVKWLHVLLSVTTSKLYSIQSTTIKRKDTRITSQTERQTDRQMKNDQWDSTSSDAESTKVLSQGQDASQGYCCQGEGHVNVQPFCLHSQIL